MEDVGRKVGRMLDKKAGKDQEKEMVDEPNLEGLKKRYLWWLMGLSGGEVSDFTREGGFGRHRYLVWQYYQARDQSGWEFTTMSKKLALQLSRGSLSFCKGFG
jgi:hypothetical protein